MTMGYGVSADQTMPAQLERLLNQSAGTALFQTINCGMNNSTIWNSLTDLGKRPMFFDIVVEELSVTNANIFRRTFSKSYPTMTAARWRAGTPTHDLLRQHLREAAEYYAARDIPFVIVFYIHRDNRVSREIQQCIQALCDENSLQLIHTLEEFSAVPTTEQVHLDVSDADLHPSPRSHGIAAGRIAADLTAFGALKNFKSDAPISEAPAAIRAVMAAMAAHGESLDVIMPWAQDALDAKSRYASNEPNPAIKARFDAEAAALGADLARTRSLWCSAGRAKAAADILGTPEGRVDHLLNAAMEDLMRAREVAVTVGSAHEAWAGSQLQDIVAAQGAEALETVAAEGVSQLSAACRAAVAAIAHEVAVATDQDELYLIRDDLRTAAESFSEIDRLWRDHHDIALAIEQELAELETRATHASRQQLAFRVARACFHRALAAVKTSVDELSAFLLAPYVDGPLMTNFVVRWQTSTPARPYRFDIAIHVKSIIPQRVVYNHYATIWEDGRSHVIQFRIPRLFVGQVSVAAYGRSGEVAETVSGLIQIEARNAANTIISVLKPEDSFRKPWGMTIFPVFQVN